MKFIALEILNEIRRKDNELQSGLGVLTTNFLINSYVESKLRDIDKWIKTQNYTGAAVDTFKKGVQTVSLLLMRLRLKADSKS